MNSFRRGLRNRHPLVLVVALALLVPALLGLQSWFTSGAWSAVPVQRWVRTSTDDYMVVSWMVGRLKQDPPSTPLVVLLGGSSGREAIVSGPSLARSIQAEGGPTVTARNLSSRMQRYAQSWAIVDNLPDTPTTVLVGVNLGRFTTSPKSNYNQVIGRELLLQSDSLRRWVTDYSGEHAHSYTILPGIFSALTSYLQQREKDLLYKGRLHARPYKPHPFDGRKTLSDERKRELVQKWLTRYYPAFRKVHEFDAEMLEGLVAEGKRRGLDIVIVELPWNREVVGDAFDEAMAAYRARTAAIAERYGVPYLDFNDEVDIPSEDFLDLSHLRPAGRAAWQAELARRLAALYADGTLRTEL
ncbi:MAG: hypothetical protein GX624_03180 [Actinobacteria bacterium]|nr:hypothetical protein [Actinomycetota bacterium]